VAEAAAHPARHSSRLERRLAREAAAAVTPSDSEAAAGHHSDAHVPVRWCSCCGGGQAAGFSTALFTLSP
jgi:hypothetical protein